MAQENRRVKMTKALLADSFLRLLKEKPLPRITVKDICDGADVNRSTYYVYYADPYDQLSKMEDNFLADQTVFIENLLASASGEIPFETSLAQMMHYWRDHKQMLQVLLGDHGDTMFSQRILLFFAKQILGSNQAQLTNIQLADYVYHASGSFGLMRYWLMQDCEESPEEIAHKITQLTASAWQ